MKKKQSRWIKHLISKDPYQMTYNELGDWIDYVIDDKVKNNCIHPMQKDIYSHLQIYLRHFHLLINIAKAKGEVAYFFMEAILSTMPEKDRMKIIKLAEELKKSSDEKILADINLMKED